MQKLHPRWSFYKAESDSCLYEMKADSEMLINVDNRKQGHRSDVVAFRDAILSS